MIRYIWSVKYLRKSLKTIYCKLRLRRRKLITLFKCYGAVIYFYLEQRAEFRKKCSRSVKPVELFWKYTYSKNKSSIIVYWAKVWKFSFSMKKSTQIRRVEKRILFCFFYHENSNELSLTRFKNRYFLRS